MPAAPAAESLLGQYRAELVAAEAALRAALEDAAQSASAIREVETELRRIWEASYGSPPPEAQRHLERLRSERAALTERKFEAQRAAAAAEQTLRRLREDLRAKELLVAGLRDELRRLTGESG